MRIGLSPRQARGFLSAVLIAATPPLFVSGAAFAAPQDRFYERSFVLAANDRCGLFEPQLTAALTAATYQARGAAHQPPRRPFVSGGCVSRASLLSSRTERSFVESSGECCTT